MTEQPAHLPQVTLPNGNAVPEWALYERMVTSGGPGGQHANKTATQVELRVQLSALDVSADEKERMFSKLKSRLRADGTVAVISSSSRSQLANRKEARKRMQRLLADALTVEAPRHTTRTPRSAIRRMREIKRHRSATKQMRQKPDTDGE